MIARTLILFVALLVTPIVTEAQRAGGDTVEWYDGHVSLQAGVSIFDRPEVAATGIYALRADMPIYPSLLAEVGLAYARPGQTDGANDVFIPGAMVQLQGTSGRFSPYVGLGAGIAVEVPQDGGDKDVSFSPAFATGVRIAVSEGAGIRVEGRVNGIGADVRAIYSELTAGLIISW